MKKMAFSMGMMVLCAAALSLVSGCVAAQDLGDGFYFAQDANWANNQKNQVVIEVRGSTIYSVNFNIITLQSGIRDMKSMAQLPDARPQWKAWASQVTEVESYIVSNPDFKASASVPGGPPNTRAILQLARKATSAQPVTRGTYSRDGWFYAEDEETDDYHTRNTVLITVVNRKIVDVLWNGILVGMPSSVNPSKMITSRANQYPMNDAPPQGVTRLTRDNRWDQQADRAAAELVRVQNPASIRVRPDGYPDGITGVSIGISNFITIAQQALAQAR